MCSWPPQNNLAIYKICRKLAFTVTSKIPARPITHDHNNVCCSCNMQSTNDMCSISETDKSPDAFRSTEVTIACSVKDDICELHHYENRDVLIPFKEQNIGQYQTFGMCLHNSNPSTRYLISHMQAYITWICNEKRANTRITVLVDTYHYLKYHTRLI